MLADANGDTRRCCVGAFAIDQSRHPYMLACHHPTASRARHRTARPAGRRPLPRNPAASPTRRGAHRAARPHRGSTDQPGRTALHRHPDIRHPGQGPNPRAVTDGRSDPKSACRRSPPARARRRGGEVCAMSRRLDIGGRGRLVWYDIVVLLQYIITVPPISRSIQHEHQRK